MTTPLFQLYHFEGQLFSDAYVKNERSECVFASFFGNFTLLQQLRARLVLPRNDTLALDELKLISLPDRDWIYVSTLTDIESKIAKVVHPTVNSLAHLMLFDPKLMTPDKVKRVGYTIQLPHEKETAYSERLWSLVKELSDVPLLDHWKDTVLKNLYSSDQLIKLTDVGGSILTAHEIAITDNFANDVSELLTSGQLIA